MQLMQSAGKHGTAAKSGKKFNWCLARENIHRCNARRKNAFRADSGKMQPVKCARKRA